MSNEKWFFHGTKLKGQKEYSKSFEEELLYIHDKKWFDGGISNDPQYWIDLAFFHSVFSLKMRLIKTYNRHLYILYE